MVSMRGRKNPDAPCAARDCDRRRQTRDWCNKHYLRWLKSGDPLHVERIRGDSVAAYEAKVDRTAGPDSCHPWLACKNQFGYGLFGHDGESLAARWAYKRFVGPLADDEVVRHTCDNRECQNQSHWIKGSQRENILDAVSRNRQWQPKGAKNVKAKLTEDQVREIRASGADRGVLAARYGVTRATICSILLRKTWAHL